MTANRSVLVVEPADDDRGGISELLRRANLTVDSAGDATRAIASIASKSHGMLVVDPATPGLTAAALAEALRGVNPRPVVLVIVDEHAPEHRGMAPDVIHGYVRRDTEANQIVELVRDCLAALRDARSMQASSAAARQMSVC